LKNLSLHVAIDPSRSKPMLVQCFTFSLNFLYIVFNSVASIVIILTIETRFWIYG